MAEEEGRTEAPTQRRLDQASASGETALSREFVTRAVLAGALVLLSSRGEGLARTLAARLALLLEQADTLPLPTAIGLFSGAAVWAVAPLCLVVCAMAAAATFGQTRFQLNPNALAPKLSRLDPLPRLSRILGPAAVMEGLRSIAKLAIVATAAWFALRGAIPAFLTGLSWTAPGLNHQMFSRVVSVALSVLCAFAVIALLDVVAMQIKHWRRLRMSRQQVRDEHRETEGDPLIKRRIRALQRQRARQRMMAAVPTATVVLTNPTHFAVALAYDRAGGGAPKIVAKGADDVAARIREAARRHGVPLVANPPLTRALFKLDIGADIPAEHYRVVAEIIAYVWRLRGRVAGGG